MRLTDGRAYTAGAVVLTTGTFLRGLIHIGERQFPAGRVGEAPAIGLSHTLERAGFALGRLKTGTPPRLDGATIDWKAVEPQQGDDPPEPFSVLTTRIDNPQVECGITRTTAATHAIIRDNVHRSPMYSGQIQSRGPRYCPSIEDKIVRFGERDGHQIFLEPEGLDDTTVYPNGISTSLPEDVQLALVASIPGLTSVRAWCGRAMRSNTITSIRASWRHRWKRSGCRAFFWPAKSTARRGMRRLQRRALLPASMRLRALGVGRPSCLTGPRAISASWSTIWSRAGVTEPYRMFTSRAEYRLTLRADNADQRLTDKGIALGCVGSERARVHQAKMAALEAARAMARGTFADAKRGRSAWPRAPQRRAAPLGLRTLVLSGYRRRRSGADLAALGRA